MCNKLAAFLCFMLYTAFCSVCDAAAVGQTPIDCQRPPQLVDPSLCCKDGGRDLVVENCAARLGIGTQGSNTSPPNAETGTCLAECILTESRYMQEPQQLNFETIEADLQKKFSNDSLYVDVMVTAFRKCEPQAQRRLQAFEQIIKQQQQQQRQLLQQQQQTQTTTNQHHCSPFSGMLLGCTYMEYFKNCPANRWTSNSQCELAKQFVAQCASGGI